VVSNIETAVEDAIDDTAEFVDNTVCSLLDQYEEWLEKFDGGKTLKDLEKVLSLFKEARQLLADVIRPDIKKLQGEIERYIVHQTPTFAIEPNWGRKAKRTTSSRPALKAPAKAVAA
jgi:hypothetical protein